MTLRYVFADEAGCFTFKRADNVSRYFIICTVTMSSLAVRDALHELRARLVWKQQELGDYFHATTDKQAVRDAFFETALKHPWRVQAQIAEKAKAQPSITQDKARFYKYPLYYLFKQGIGPHVQKDDQVLFTAASIGTKKERLTYTNALADVMDQTTGHDDWRVDFRPCSADPCLQLADYCAWAIQRRWERNDTRSYDLISSRITYEYDMWSHGKKFYY